MQSKVPPRQTERQPDGHSQGTRSRRGLGFWLRRGVVWMFAGLLALVVIGLIYQVIATQIDQRSVSPAPGQMVSVGNHQLHINCIGKGSPTVILEAGWAFTSLEWSAHVQPEVAKHTRVCPYDRAGLAWSELGPGSKDATQVTGELHALLDKAGIKGPYVLAGHSLGGLYARVYADRYPEDVAGMVLVQSMHPDQFERLGMASALKMNRRTGLIGAPLARMGVVRLSVLFPPSSDLPPLQRKQADSLYYQTSHLVAELGELSATPEVMAQVRQTGALGDKPLAVVSGGSAGSQQADAMADSKSKAARIEREVPAMQEDLTHLSSDSTQRVVQGAADDSLVLNRSYGQQTSEEIVRVVEAVRTDQPLSR
jgi:pimeloyl-ACP methyl ester carboxylesterase